MLDSLLKRAHMEVQMDGNDSVLSADTDWNVPLPASMSDASKRRCDTSPERELRNHGYVDAATAGMPPPMVTRQSYGKTKRGLEIVLPEGLDDLAMWGRSVVEFGKFSNRGWTYSELAESGEMDVMSYTKWCKGQVDNAEGLLRDFALYLWAREYQPGQLPVIPGTDHVRKLR